MNVATAVAELIDRVDQGFRLRFPQTDNPLDLEQDEEWCFVEHGGREQRIRFHDYDKIFRVPGLYEALFYDKLECKSPEMVCMLLEHEIRKNSEHPSDLSVLDVGAGNGIVGEILARMGVPEIIGIDIIDEAAEAAGRDRPGLYQEYFVEDLTNLSFRTRHNLQSQRLNCLTTVAALGFNDIPPSAFANAYNLIENPGWIAFNIRDKFLTNGDMSGFSQLIRRMVDNEILDLCVKHTYFHRLALDGTPLEYVAVVGKKHQNIPEEWFGEFE